MALTDLKVRTATVPEGKKQVKLADGNGLYLLVTRSGKYWRHDYAIHGKRKTYSIGTYPAIPLAGKKDHRTGSYLKGARDIALEVRRLIKENIDPSLKKQEEKALKKAVVIAEKKRVKSDQETFEKVSRDWHALRKNKWMPKHARTVLRRLERHIFPHIGLIPVSTLSKADITEVLRPLLDAGANNLASRIYGYIKRVLDYADDIDLIEDVLMPKRDSIIPEYESIPMPAIIEPGRIGEFMRAVDGYNATHVVCTALKLLPLVATRTGEFRQAHWTEFDLEAGIWTIPATHRKLQRKRKMNPDNVHFVPLSRQALVLLRDLYQWTGRGKHVFPSVRGDARPMSENTLNVAIKALGFGDEMVGHGVRTMFSTTLNGDKFNPDAIEVQLQHKDQDSVRAAYNRAKYIKDREEIMQYWADWLDEIRIKGSFN